MITASKSDNLKLKNVGPWFSWHPKFISQSEIHRSFYCDPKIMDSGSFNTADSIFTFRPDGSLVGHYESIYHGAHLKFDEPTNLKDPPKEDTEKSSVQANNDDTNLEINCNGSDHEISNQVPLDDNNSPSIPDNNNEDDDEDDEENSSSCADSSDFDDEEKSHRFSRVFVVNNDDDEDDDNNEDDENEEEDSLLPSYHETADQNGVILKTINPNLENTSVAPPSVSKNISNDISYSADSADNLDTITLKSIRKINPEILTADSKSDNVINNNNDNNVISDSTVPDSLEVWKSDKSALEKNAKESVSYKKNKRIVSDDTLSESMLERQVKAVSEVSELLVGENEVDGSETTGGEPVCRGTPLESVELGFPSKLKNYDNKYLQSLSNNKYKSLVMITSNAYQPVSVITSDTTTLLQPDDSSKTQCEPQQQSSGLAGYYHLALEALETPQLAASGPRRPLMVKRRSDRSTEITDSSQLSADFKNFQKTAEFNHFEKTADFNHSKKSADFKNFDKSADFNNSKKSADFKNFDKSADFNNFEKSADFDRSADFKNFDRSADSNDFDKSADFNHSKKSADFKNFEKSANFDKPADFNHFEKSADFDRSADFEKTADFNNSKKSADFRNSKKSADFKNFDKSVDFNNFEKSADFNNSKKSADFNNSKKSADFNNSEKSADFKNFEKSADFDRSADLNNSEKSSDLNSRECSVQKSDSVKLSPTQVDVILEEGLADDDSWVEEVSHDEDEQSTPTTNTEDSSEDEANHLSGDREEELRGYHRQAIDFTLHTIVEESCEESEAEFSLTWKSKRPPSTSELEKYFFFGLGGVDSRPDNLDSELENNLNLFNDDLKSTDTLSREIDSLSETSSVYSEGVESLKDPGINSDSANDNSSRLEKYFLSEFLGFREDRRDSDGSVGSDSEGRPSPEAQRRKRLVRARGTGRSHSSSLDNLLALTQNSGSQNLTSQNSLQDLTNQDSPDESDDSTVPDEDVAGFVEGVDTVKRKKKKRNLGNHPEGSNKSPELEEDKDIESFAQVTSEEERSKTPQAEAPDEDDRKQSRDSGFVGSCDDLIQPEPVDTSATELKNFKDNVNDKKEFVAIPINHSLSRKDSFNNWSSDEETNLMMSKMRQFFKTMVANSNSAAAPVVVQQTQELPRGKRTKPPQLVYFENELTRLMKTVPGIRDDQVREIVEYLSSEDTWSDSYDSSDYTSSDLEGATSRSTLQEQISASCQQIISNFDMNSETADQEPSKPTNIKDTAFVYQKLVQSFTKIAGDSSDASSTPYSSPPLIAKVMHHIGSRLVALMHQVSENNSPSNSWRRYPQHTRTPSSASTTEDESTSESAQQTPTFSHLQLPRSKSHDPLLLINSHQVTGAESEEREEKETSDYERFSWRGSFESALMAADSRNKLSLISSGDIGATANVLAMAAKRRSAGDLLFNPKSFSREQLDRVRSCGSIGASNTVTTASSVGQGSVEEKIWSNRRRSSVPDDPRHRRRKSAAEKDQEDNDSEFEFDESRAMTLPRGLQTPTSTSTTNSLPRLPAITSAMHKAHSMYHFLPSNTGVKSARYRPPGFARNLTSAPKRALSAPGLEIPSPGKRERRRAPVPDEDTLSEACSTPIIGGAKRFEPRGRLQDLNRASLSSLGARSDSMASVYSGAGEGKWCGSVAVRGEVEFSLQYDYKQLTFQVMISQCKDLAPVDVKRNRSDPYVKVYLLPDKSKGGKRKTKVKKHTLNPVFDETLKFNINLNSLENRILWLTVWHSDMFGRNDFLGEVRMPLENKIFDDPTPKWYHLQERSEAFDDPVERYKGEVIVGLKFVPPELCQLENRERESVTIVGEPRKGKKNWSRGSLHVLVKEARNLQTKTKNSGTCDPFCKSYLLPDKGRAGKQKTSVVRKSDGNPVWGHTFIYKDVSLQELAERGLELTVWDHDRIASNEFLGGVRFNLGTSKHYGKPVDWMDATGRELSLWQNMLERPNFWVEGAITLRPNLYNHGKHNFS
ncbi:hypothetical protein KQX54_011128 [Cotesia glomerata]|uniref:C2 domain-containing protein n=1 Tax=Cotesia glomerata TaxID=32391 RepID=A0AAV7ILI3_COTGL|nr:hypothetical protein KQX54_011128 [Cotesia glomerata]